MVRVPKGTGYVAARDALAGESLSENEAHAIARVTLLNLLVCEPDSIVIPHFEKWESETDLGRAANRAVALLDELAQVCGLEHRAQLFEPGRKSLRIQTEDREQYNDLKDLNARALEACEALIDIPETAQDSAYVSDAAVRLVRDEWKRPWPWLAIELTEMFVHGLFGHVLGVQYEKHHWHEPLPGPLDQPMIESTVRIEIPLGYQGETVAEAIERTMESIKSNVIPIFETVIENSEAPDVPQGQFTDPEQIKRYVAWWYRKRLRNEYWRTIAREYSPDGDARQTVKYGVKQAERLLSVPSWTFKSDHNDCAPLGKCDQG